MMVLVRVNLTAGADCSSIVGDAARGLIQRNAARGGTSRRPFFCPHVRRRWQSGVAQRLIQLVLLREMQTQNRIQLIQQVPDLLRAFQVEAVRRLVGGDAL